MDKDIISIMDEKYNQLMEEAIKLSKMSESEIKEYLTNSPLIENEDSRQNNLLELDISFEEWKNRYNFHDAKPWIEKMGNL